MNNPYIFGRYGDTHAVTVVPYVVGINKYIFVPVRKHGQVVMVPFVEDEFHFTRQPTVLFVVFEDDVPEVHFHLHGAARFDFLAESNILKRLQHPMLPRIVDIFETPENVYIVEDFVNGITLDELLSRQGRVDEEQGLQWFQELCSVLDYLHNQQPHPIIYRDMKPSNIMLQPDGTLKLIDFGIAREFKQDSNGDTTYIGTKGYAAPEQFGKAQTDARTDLYSLRVTMHHLKATSEILS